MIDDTLFFVAIGSMTDPGGPLEPAFHAHTCPGLEVPGHDGWCVFTENLISAGIIRFH